MITQSELALDITRSWRSNQSAVGNTRGVCRHIQALGYVPLVEFPLSSDRRADILALDRRGSFVLIEIKSNLADYRGDTKWPGYLPHSDRLYFAVA